MIWYFHIEGRSSGNEQIKRPFGFFVHALVSAGNEHEAEEIVVRFLSDEGLEVADIRHRGLFESFIWNNEDLEEKLRNLANLAGKCDGTPFFSEFHSWILEENESEIRGKDK